MSQDLSSEPGAQEANKATSVVSAIANPGAETVLSHRPNPQQFNLVFGVSGQQGVQPDAITGKVTEAHISKAIEYAAERDSRAHQERKFSAIVWAALAIAFLLGTIGLCWLFLSYNKPELLEKILHILLAFGTGAAGGYGLGRSTTPGPKSE